MKLKTNTTLLLVFSSLIILIAGFFLAIRMGASTIGLKDIYNSIFHYEESLEQMLIRDVRIPRALCVLITGGILAVTGSVMQGVTRNPIAEPSLLGISQGATLVIACFYGLEIVITPVNTLIAALIGAFFSGFLVIGFTLKKAGNMSVGRLLLAGTALSTFFISLTSVIGLITNRAQFIGFWISGGFRNASWNDVIMLCVIGGIGLMILILMSGNINLLSLGDDVTIGLGRNPGKIRFLSLITIIPMCAAAVAAGKNIGFVGLILPQVTRLLIGQNYKKMIPCSFLLGGILLTFADIGARMVFAPYEMPIGIFTSIIGVPFFIFMARKERG